MVSMVAIKCIWWSLFFVCDLWLSQFWSGLKILFLFVPINVAEEGIIRISGGSFVIVVLLSWDPCRCRPWKTKDRVEPTSHPKHFAGRRVATLLTYNSDLCDCYGSLTMTWYQDQIHQCLHGDASGIGLKVYSVQLNHYLLHLLVMYKKMRRKGLLSSQGRFNVQIACFWELFEWSFVYLEKMGKSKCDFKFKRRVSVKMTSESDLR